MAATDNLEFLKVGRTSLPRKYACGAEKMCMPKSLNFLFSVAARGEDGGEEREKKAPFGTRSWCSGELGSSAFAVMARWLVFWTELTNSAQRFPDGAHTQQPNARINGFHQFN